MPLPPPFPVGITLLIKFEACITIEPGLTGVRSGPIRKDCGEHGS